MILLFIVHPWHKISLISTKYFCNSELINFTWSWANVPLDKHHWITWATSFLATVSPLIPPRHKLCSTGQCPLQSLNFGAYWVSSDTTGSSSNIMASLRGSHQLTQEKAVCRVTLSNLGFWEAQICYGAGSCFGYSWLWAGIHSRDWRKWSGHWSSPAAEGVHLKDQPITFLRKALGPSYQKLSIYEKEFLALIMAVERWRPYLQRQEFIIRTDHHSLSYLTEQNLHSEMQHKAMTQLMGLQFKVIYKKGKTTWLLMPSHSAGLLQPLPIPSGPWQDLTMDFIEVLPSLEWYNSILVVVDRYTKYAHFIPLKHPFTAQTVVRAVLHQVIKLHGFPKTIVSDRDRIFTSVFWKELFSLFGTCLLRTTAYHPQIDGQSERVNQCLEMYLRCVVHDSPKKWKNWLTPAELWYNSCFHTSLGCSPFKK